ncbi:HNH endonuclease signature motif containing protein [Brachybacterium paraconglomeratum]
MTNSSGTSGPEGEHSPQAFLDGLRQAGPAALAEALGDLAHLLQEIAGDPGDAFELAGRARRDFTNLLGNLQACVGAMDVLEARSVVALRDITRRDRYAEARDQAAHENGAEPSRNAVDEAADYTTKDDLSQITRRSPHMAGRTLASAQRLLAILPQMLDALRTGKISSDAAYAVAGSAAGLPPEVAREVDHRLGQRLSEFDGAGTRRWQDAVATIAGELDPVGATLRHRRALKERHVTMTPGQNGMASLSARLSAVDAARIHKRFSLEAERRRAAGAREGHGAAMADAFADTLLGRDGGAIEPGVLDIGLIITDRAMFRPDSGDTAHLEGYGPVPAEAVREQLRAATTEPEDPAVDPYGDDGPAVRAEIRRLYTHPTTGELVAMDSTARAFPPAMKRFLTWRDTSCRGPFCNAAIRQSDHIVPVSRGGPTSLDNGQDTCAHCNKKEKSAASVERTEDPDVPGHAVTWTGHSGVSRVTTPTPLIFERRPDEEEAPSIEPESGPSESGPPETGPPETGTPKSGTPETATPELGAPESAAPDQTIGQAIQPARSTVTRRRRQRAAGPPPPQRRAPQPPARSEPAATDAPGASPARRVSPSDQRKDRAEPADDPDH